jgi:putative alpha-1,2-mannosidase
VGVPLFPRVVIHRPEGDLTVETDADPQSHPVIERVMLDGVALASPYLRHAQLVGEHVLRVSLRKE